MNFDKYGSWYSRFRGCTSFRIESDMIVLDLTHVSWETWLVLRLHSYRKVLIGNDQKPFLQALKTYFKTEDATSVICKDDSWTILIGEDRAVMPMSDEKKARPHFSSFQLYATPYFVTDPNTFDTYLKSVSRPAYDHIYPYKNTIIFLDSTDAPYPAGCYFNDSKTVPLYHRICLLTDETPAHVAAIAAEWKTRRNVLHIPFLSQETLALPKFLSTQPQTHYNFDKIEPRSTHMIHKKMFTIRPEYLLQDVLKAYLQNQPDSKVDNLGLVMEWPLRLTFNEARANVDRDDIQMVAFAINGQRPNKIVSVRQPYERYFEYDGGLPENIVWSLMFYEPNFLAIPLDVEKVSIDSTVIGVVYKNTFFCLSRPLLEGTPIPESQTNVHVLLTPVTATLMKDPSIKIHETYRHNEQYSLHRVELKNFDKYELWCLASAKSVHPYPHQPRIPVHVAAWLRLFDRHRAAKGKVNVDVNNVRMAITLAHHRVCFNTKIIAENKQMKRERRIELTNDSLDIWLEEDATEFVNCARLADYKKEESSCCVM